MTRMLVTFCLATAGLTAEAQAPPPKVKPSDARKHVGKDATICGRAKAFDCSDKREKLLIHLDSPPWSSGVDVAIPIEKRSLFGDRFEDGYLGAQICATGRVAKEGNRHSVTLESPAGIVVETPAERPAGEFAPGALPRCTPGVENAVLTHEVAPSYTRNTMAARIQGRMLLEAMVLPDGSVGDIRVLHPLDRELDYQGVSAVRQWRFRPAKRDGVAVPVLVTIEMSFRLK